MHLVANLQTPEQVVPAITSLNDPPSRLVSRISLALGFFLAARLDVRHVPSPRRAPTNLRIIVTLVVAEVLSHLAGRWPTQHNSVQRGVEHLHVVPVRARERDGQGNAIGIREGVSLGTQFAPVGRVFSGLVPPLTGAGTVALSID